MLAQFGSGFPYTPEAYNSTPIYEETNEERLPWTKNVDLRMRRFFDVLGDMRVGVVLEVLNVFNTKNAISWDEDNVTGTGDGVIDAYRNRIGYINSANPTGARNFGGYANSVPDPSAWNPGRRIRLGLSVEF
jgi:hypothetical protein